MREYRGKNDKGMWVYGNVYVEHFGKGADVYFIIDDSGKEWDVPKETIGQDTGMTDGNKKNLYEGDLVQDLEGTVFEIYYEKETGGYLFQNVNNAMDYFGYTDAAGLEKIGNKYDNPERLRG